MPPNPHHNSTRKKTSGKVELMAINKKKLVFKYKLDLRKERFIERINDRD